MNIVFWAVVVLASILVWFSISSFFWDIGDFFSGLFQNAKDAIEETEENEED